MKDATVDASKLSRGGWRAVTSIRGGLAPPAYSPFHAVLEIVDFPQASAASPPRPWSAHGGADTVGSTEGERIGWHDAEYFHFLPQVAYHTVAAFAREEGQHFGMKERALRDALAEEGLLHAEDGHHTTNLRVGKETLRLLRIRRAAFETLWGQN